MSQPNGDIRSLIEYLTKGLVDAPGAVVVDQYEDGDETVLEVEVAPEDVGRVIGRQGRTVRALRTLASAAGAKQDKRYAVEVVE